MTEKSEIIFESGEKKRSELLFCDESLKSADIIGAECEKAIVVCDENTEKFASLPPLKSLPRVVLKSGESAKTFASAEKIIVSAAESGLSKKSAFIAIGGGAVCDVAAFAASIYMRGARLFLIPTTFLAQIDAAIGGKTACDAFGTKNLAGTFFPADKIFVFDEFLQDLSEKEFLNGLAEAAKISLVCAPKVYQILRDEKEKILGRDKGAVHSLAKRCAVAKASIVERDLRDEGVRRTLNLGHTFAHALEAATGFGVSHGEAVAWGISRSAALSCRMGLCKEEYRAEVFDFLEQYGWQTSPLPKEAQGIESPCEKLLQAMRRDKKNMKAGEISLVLQRGMNACLVQDVSEREILQVLQGQ